MRAKDVRRRRLGGVCAIVGLNANATWTPQIVREVMKAHSLSSLHLLLLPLLLCCATHTNEERCRDPVVRALPRFANRRLESLLLQTLQLL